MITLPTVSVYAAVVGNAQRPLVKAGTVTNVKYGLVNTYKLAFAAPGF